MWVLFAIAATIVNAIYFICNQNIKLKPSVFCGLSRFVGGDDGGAIFVFL